MVATFIMIYIIKLGIDMCAYTLVNAADVTGALLGGIRRIGSVFAPVITSLAAFYVLSPLVEGIKKRIRSRRLACTLVFVLTLLPVPLIITAGCLHLKGIGGGSLGTGISLWYSECIKNTDRAYMQLKELLEKAGLEKVIMPYFEGFLNKMSERFSFEGFYTALGAGLLNFLLGMVMAFYLLVTEKPFEGVKRFLSVILPQRLYRVIRIGAGDIDAAFSGYIRGQLTDGLIMAVLTGVTLRILKIPFAIPIGIVSGFSNIIPYFGSAVGFALTALSAILSGNYASALYGCGAMLLLQQLDSAVIVPRVVGKRVAVSPFWVIAALSIGGRLFGLWGMVFAVPLTGAAKVILMRVYKRKTENNLS